MNIQTDLLKKPQSWAVIAPAVLAILAITTTIGMFHQRSLAEYQMEETRQATDKADMIATILKQSGHGNLQTDAPSRNFDSVASARLCATAARIPESKLTRGESSKRIPRKDGSFLYKENYNLKNVRLMQIAKFVDHAELNYSSLSCTRVSINDSRNKSKNSWDATVNFQYIKNSKK